MQILAAYTESFCIITPGGFLYRRVLYKYMLASPAQHNIPEVGYLEKEDGYGDRNTASRTQAD